MLFRFGQFGRASERIVMTGFYSKVFCAASCPFESWGRVSCMIYQPSAANSESTDSWTPFSRSDVVTGNEAT